MRTANVRKVGLFALVPVLISTLMSLVSILLRADRGFDFTDEGYYLVWISDPWAYQTSVSQFGYILHPFYEMVGGSIADLRRLGVLFSYALGILCSWALFNDILSDKVSTEVRAAVHVGMPVSVLAAYWSWLPTPNYNHLALQGLLLAAAGLALVLKPREHSWFGWCGAVMLGCGGWLTFMAKPTSAVALAVMVTVCCLASYRTTFRFVAAAALAGSVLFCIGALAIDGGILAYLRRLTDGAALASSLGGGHTVGKLLRLDSLKLGQFGGPVLLVAALGVVAMLALCARTSRPRFVQPVLFLLLACVVALYAGGDAPSLNELERLGGKLMLVVPIAAFMWRRLSETKDPEAAAAQFRTMMVFFLLVLPYAYAFGTNRNYWTVGAFAGYFWAAGGLLLALPSLLSRPGLLICVVLCVQVITAVQLNAGYQNPYRQPESLAQQTAETHMRPGSSERLMLSADSSQYIVTARALAGAAGFAPGQPVVDMTGQSPGLLYTLGARSVGQAWLIGGYRGSSRRAAQLLVRQPCEELARSWLLVERDGPRRLSETLTQAFGASFPTDYDAVAQWSAPAGVGGNLEPRTQVLYRPNRADGAAIAACEMAKRDRLVERVQEPMLERYMK